MAGSEDVKPSGAAARGLCPRCGSATFFSGLATRERCPACGLDFSAYQLGSGSAGFLTLLVGALVTVLALGIETRFHPPFWVHLLWFPFTMAAVILLLRYARALLLTRDYRRAASKGQVE